VFGELTWHFMKQGSVIVGARHFSQQFTDDQLYHDWTFPADLEPTRVSPASKTVGKANVSYEYGKNQYVYALWSQGFRRGGANTVPYPPNFYAESPLLRYYQPDKTNNYEVGLKGRLSNGLSYTVAVFDIKWDNPQVSASLPSGNLAVYNVTAAESKGIELESAGPLFVHGFGYNVSFAYADATLSSDFSLPANNGAGVITPGELNGHAGQQLPGSPKTSAAATLTYDQNFAPDYDLTLAVNGTYRTRVLFNLSSFGLGTSGISQSTSYEVMNLYATLSHKPWRYTAYITNVLDRQDYLVPPAEPNLLNHLTDDYVVNPPREIGIRVGYTF